MQGISTKKLLCAVAPLLLMSFAALNGCSKKAEEEPPVQPQTVVSPEQLSTAIEATKNDPRLTAEEKAKRIEQLQGKK